MAYGTKYTATWGSFTGIGGYLYIKEKNYSGGDETITLRDDAVVINRNFTDLETHVLGFNCEFYVHNDRSDFFDLLELLYGTDQEYLVQVIVTTPVSQAATVFEGFIDVKASQQKYLHKQIIHLVASSYLSRLDFVKCDSVETLQNKTYIDLISEMLRSIGSTSNIRVNCKLYADGDTLSTGKSLFNLNGLYTEIYWENNIDRKTSLEILEGILTSYDCYIYWWDGYWYIEHYTDIWQTSIDFVEYDIDTAYAPDDTGTVVPLTRSITDIHTLQFAKTLQTLFVNPGIRLLQIRINIKEGLLLNFIINDFSSIEAVSTDYPVPSYRKWMVWGGNTSAMTWFNGSDSILAYKTITNSITRVIAAPASWTELHRGLYTRFAITINSESILNINFKYGLSQMSVSPDVWDGETYAGLSISFHWYLRERETGYFIVYDETGGFWYRSVVSEANALQTTVVSGDAFDKENGIVDVSISVPIGDLQGVLPALEGNTSFILCIGTETMNFLYTSSPYIYSSPAVIATFGDVIITVAGEQLANNIIEGTLNTDFLETKTIELDIADIGNLNYKNNPLRGSDLDEQTDTWTRDGVTKLPLSDWILIDKFRVYNQSRQKITAINYISTILKPFSLYTDSKQSDKKFVLMGLRHSLAEGEQEMDFREYDNDTVVNLNEA